MTFPSRSTSTRPRAGTLGLGLWFLGLAACATSGTESGGLALAPSKAPARGALAPELAPVPEPLALTGSAYEAAGLFTLPDVDAGEHTGLHNLYWLSDQILSGSEPEGPRALEKLADLGIRTVLSVDGKAPEHQSAERYGLQYVHVPIRYSGLEPDELLSIAKTFQELEGPFYVHCFHGQHRGPAAAAVGRVLLDGASREEAIAEMRQYCGTSEKYEGLYSAIALGDLPAPEEVAGHPFDFAPEHRVDGLRAAMIDLPRSFDTLVDMSKRDWRPNPNHPDANARNEAARMVEMFEQLQTLPEVTSAPEDFREHVDSSLENSRRLLFSLDAYGQAANSADVEAAGNSALESLQALRSDCRSCHAEHRN